MAELPSEADSRNIIGGDVKLHVGISRDVGVDEEDRTSGREVVVEVEERIYDAPVG